MHESTARRIGQVDVAVSDEAAAVAAIVAAVAAHVPRTFAFCNAHTANVARGSAAMAAALAGAIVFNDGVGLDIASRLLYGAPFPANLNGTDLTARVLAALPPGTRVFLVGGPPGVAEAAAAAIVHAFSQVAIVGTQNGFFAASAEPALAQRIDAAGAQLILAAMGNPVQELWAARNRDRLAGVVMCVGAYLDFVSGRASRAPRWVQRTRSEWAYRLLREPRRLARRYLLGNATFLIAVARQRATGKA